MFFAPGRVNLVGAHLDYNGGPVLPLAVDCGTYVGARLRSDSWIRLRSLNSDVALDIDARRLGATCEIEHGWASYPLGVWRTFAEAFGRTVGVEMVFAGDVPIAAGLSSSAAMEVATVVALDALHEIGATRRELALIAHRAETGYVGLACGIMDQFASALGKPGHALLLDCYKLDHTYVPVDSASFDILLMDTDVPRALSETRFNERVAECDAAHRILREIRDLPCLAAYQATDLEAAGSRLNGVYRRRATHVVQEVGRVADAVVGLRSKDVAAVGRALNDSHSSTREHFDVSCLELDVLTDAARELDAVYGARLTGAGFGGCAIALIRPGTANEVVQHVGERFYECLGRKPGFRLLRLGSGAAELPLPSS